MSLFLIWRRGIKGPTIAVTTSKHMDEYDRTNKLCAPIEIKPEEEHLSIQELEKIYPPPKQDYPDRIAPPYKAKMEGY